MGLLGKIFGKGNSEKILVEAAKEYKLKNGDGLEILIR